MEVEVMISKKCEVKTRLFKDVVIEQTIKVIMRNRILYLTTIVHEEYVFDKLENKIFTVKDICEFEAYNNVYK